MNNFKKKSVALGIILIILLNTYTINQFPEIHTSRIDNPYSEDSSENLQLEEDNTEPDQAEIEDEVPHINPPSFYTNINNLTGLSGTTILSPNDSASRLAALTAPDDDNYLSVESVSHPIHGQQFIGIEFKFGSLPDYNVDFNNFPMDYFDCYLYAAIETSNEFTSDDKVRLQKYTVKDGEYCWEDIDSIDGPNNDYHMKRKLIQRAFKFRIYTEQDDLYGVRQIFIDEIRIILTHSGTFENKLDTVSKYEINPFGWGGYYASNVFREYEGWYLDPDDGIASYQQRNSLPVQADLGCGAQIKMYMNEGTLMEIKNVNEMASTFSYGFFMVMGSYGKMHIKNYSSGNFEYTQSWDVPGWGGGGLPRTTVNWDEIPEIENNIDNFIYSDLINKENYWEFMAQCGGLGVPYVASDGTLWAPSLNVYEHYANAEASVIGYDFEGQNYPSMRIEINPVSPITDTDNNFFVKADIMSKHVDPSFDEIKSARCRLVGNSYDSDWINMIKDTDGRWNAPVNPNDLSNGDGFGVYTIWVEGFTGENYQGLSTKSPLDFIYMDVDVDETNPPIDPSSFYTNMNEYIALNGTQILSPTSHSSRLLALIAPDDGEFLSVESVTHPENGQQFMGIEFRYGTLFDHHIDFNSFPMDYFDCYLYANINTSSEFTSDDRIRLQKYTIKNGEFCWEDIDTIEGTNNDYRIERKYIQRAFKFRIFTEQGDLDGVRQISVDQLRIILTHSGTFENRIHNITGYDLDPFGWGGVYANDVWIDNDGWYLDPDDGIYSYQQRNSLPVQADLGCGAEIKMYTNKGVLIDVKNINDWETGFSYRFFMVMGSYGQLHLRNFSSGSFEHTQRWDVPGWGGGGLPRTNFNWNSVSEIGNGLNDLFNNNPITKEIYWEYQADCGGLGVPYVASDGTLWAPSLTVYDHYADVDVNVIGYDFAGQNYPTMTIETDPISPITKSKNNFFIKANIRSKHFDPSFNAIKSARCRIVGNSYDSEWLHMTVGEDGRWNTPINPVNLINEGGYGSYTVWVEGFTGENYQGLSTKSPLDFEVMEPEIDEDVPHVNPDSFYTNINNLTGLDGTSILSPNDDTSKLAALTAPDDGNYLTVESISHPEHGQQFMGVEFRFGTLPDHNVDFNNFPMDYFDCYLYADIKTGNEFTPNDRIRLQKYTVKDGEFCWEDIDSIGGPNNDFHLQRKYVQRAFKFRIYTEQEDLEGVRIIYIDRIRIILVHKGTFENKLDKITGYNLNPFGWGGYEPYNDFKHYDDWYLFEQDSIYSYQQRNSWGTANLGCGATIKMYMNEGTIVDVKNLNEMATSFSYEFFLVMGSYGEIHIKNFSSNAFEHTQHWDVLGWGGGGLPRTMVNWESFLEIQNNPIDLFDNDISSKKVFWEFKAECGGLGVPYLSQSEDIWYYPSITVYDHYANAEVTVVGYDFEGQNYPVVKVETDPFSPIIGDGSIFSIKADIRSNHYDSPFNNIQSARCRILGHSYDSDWLPLTRDESGKWIKPVNSSDLTSVDGDGTYTIWVEGFTGENYQGLSTMAHYDFICKNERPEGQINIIEPESRYYYLNDSVGVLLSFETSPGLDLVSFGYSLDDSEIIPISGWVIIPYPNEGLHTVQVFGTDISGTTYQSEKREFGIDFPIDIISPKRLSSYFLETSNFQDDYVGTTPDGWILGNSGTSTTTIVSERYGRRKVLRCYDGPGAGLSNSVKITKKFLPLEKGIIEFNWATDDSMKPFEVQFRDPDGNIAMTIRQVNGNYYYYDGDLHYITGTSNNVFGYHKIYFDCQTELFNWTDGFVWLARNARFKCSGWTNINEIDHIVLTTAPFDNSEQYNNYFDNFKVSYNKHGILLDIDIPSSLDLSNLRYSVDGQRIVRFSGTKAVIADPGAGETHTIQVFGTYEGIYTYTSEKRFFHVSELELQTNTGTDVLISDPITGIELTFDDVVDNGTTTISTSDTTPTPPSRFEVAGQYYEINSDVTFLGTITIGIPYDENQIPYDEETSVKLFHWEPETGWTDVTTYVDTDNNIVYGEVTSFSIFVVMKPGDQTPPVIIIEYLDGNETDGNPGKWNVFAYDKESGINEATLKIYVDDEYVGNELGDYLIPNNLGEHIIYVEVENNNTANPILGYNLASVNIADDDITPPDIFYVYTGEGTDENPGELIVNASDDSGLSDDPSGTYTVPNSLGTHTFTFSATDADNDRLSDSLTSSIIAKVNIVDDDINPPELSNLVITHDFHYINISFEAIDQSGISEISIFINGELIEPISQSHDGNAYTFTLSNQWILKNDIYEIEIQVIDNDNDRPDDSLTSTISGTFAITLEEMYQYVDWQIEMLKDYIDDNLCFFISWLIRHKLTLAQKQLTKAYDLIENGRITCGLFHDAVAKILIRITEFKIEIFNRLSFISDENAEFMLNSIHNIRNNIVILIGASVGIEQAYDIALVEIDLLNLKDVIEDEIDLWHRLCISHLLSGATSKLELAMLKLSLGINVESTLNSAQCKLTLAEKKIDCLANRGKISQVLATILINKINQVKSDIEIIKNSFY